MADLPPSVDQLTHQIEAERVRTPAVGSRWMIAVSGGPDSMALLRALHLLQSRTGVEIACGHVDHRLRPESEQDAAWVRSQCDALDINCLVECATLYREVGVSSAIEERARDERYRLLTMMAHRWGATAVLTGHTADDQAETILHHLLRGTGLRGLSGMPRVRPLDDMVSLWRPMLEVRRTLIMSALKEWGQSCLTDSTNSSSAFTRNRIRLELIPWIEREVNPRMAEAVLRLSSQSLELQEWVEAEADKLLDLAWISSDQVSVRLDRRLLEKSTPVLVRECFVRLWIRRHWPRQAMTSKHWQRLAEFCRNQTSKVTQMPGKVSARHRQQMIVIERSP